ncbi:hypothetical protein PGT21_026353 [Puccinia graminis f. sp. tritici]|uniref:Uncharacterized protein n=1 Tax=Puccinia graminis f. sp. tritici TaxID=56615 RepID=A0A5B0NFA1_PUCGR|nr:hypothetical protein PGT21_026353 [Puccinia graminis f. sp. tritici]
MPQAQIFRRGGGNYTPSKIRYSSKKIRVDLSANMRLELLALTTVIIQQGGVYGHRYIGILAMSYITYLKAI